MDHAGEERRGNVFKFYSGVFLGRADAFSGKGKGNVFERSRRRE